MFSGAIEFDPKKGNPKTSLDIVEFSPNKIILKGFSHKPGTATKEIIRNIPITYPKGLSDNNNDFSENSIELSVNGKLYKQQPKRDEDIFHEAKLHNVYIDTQLEKYQLDKAKIKAHTFTAQDTLIVSWYNNFSKEQIELLSKGFTDKYKNLQKIDSEKNTIRYVYKANNQRVQNFKMSESVPPIKRIDQDRWSGVEDIYISIKEIDHRLKLL